MTTELATLDNNDLETLQRTGKMLAASGFFEAKGNSEQAVAQMAVKILAGRELGFGPFAAVDGIHIIQGKPTVGANLMASAVKNHPRYDYRVRKLDNTECSIEFFEFTGDGKKESIGVSTFTAQDAKAAGTKNMDKFARNMLFARAMSNGVRFYVPDVFSGNSVYVPEELGADVDGDGNVVDGGWQEVQPTPQPQQPAPATSNADDVQFMANDGGGENPFVDDSQDDQEPEQESNIARLRRQFHAVGTQLYSDEWDDKRHALVQHISGGKKSSSNELTEKQLEKLISGMQEKLDAAKEAA